MEEKSSNHQGYSIIEESDSDDEFSFVTAHGIKYIVYFAEADGYAPSASFAQELRMFGFGSVNATRPVTKLPADARVEITLFEILYYYISKRPNAVLVFVCSDESVWNPGPNFRHSRFAKWRSKIFSRWYQKWQKTGVMPAVKIDYDLYGVIYCSCLFRSGNPYEEEIKQIIEQTKLHKQR